MRPTSGPRSPAHTPHPQPHPSTHRPVNHALTRPHATVSCQSPLTLVKRIIFRPLTLTQPTGFTKETIQPHYCAIPVEPHMPISEFVNIHPGKFTFHPQNMLAPKASVRIFSNSQRSATNRLVQNTHPRLPTVDTFGTSLIPPVRQPGSLFGQEAARHSPRPTCRRAAP